MYGHIRSFLTFSVPALKNSFPILVRKFDSLVKHCKRIEVSFANDLNLPPCKIPLKTSDNEFYGVKRTLSQTKLEDVDNDGNSSHDWDTENEESVHDGVL